MSNLSCPQHKGIVFCPAPFWFALSGSSALILKCTPGASLIYFITVRVTYSLCVGTFLFGFPLNISCLLVRARRKVIDRNDDCLVARMTKCGSEYQSDIIRGKLSWKLNATEVIALLVQGEHGEGLG